MTADSKQLLIVVIALLIVGLAFLVIRWPQTKDATFSQHAAAHKVTICYYIGLFALTLPLLAIYLVDWLAPTYKLSGWFMTVAVVSEVLQFMVTLIPETGGQKTIWHRRLTGMSAILLLPALSILLCSNVVSLATRVLIAACLGLMLVILVVVTVNRRQPRNALLLQASYYAAFFIALLAVTY